VEPSVEMEKKYAGLITALWWKISNIKKKCSRFSTNYTEKGIYFHSITIIFQSPLIQEIVLGNLWDT
jgi:hypothetical protein